MTDSQTNTPFRLEWTISGSSESIPLQPGRYMVGFESECDIIIPSLRTGHAFSFTLSSGYQHEAVITSADTTLRVDGVQLETGQSVKCRQSSNILCEDMNFTLIISPRGLVASSSSKRRSMPLFVVGAFVVAGAAWWMNKSDTKLQQPEQTAALLPAPYNPIQQPNAQFSRAVLIEQPIRQRLMAANLMPAVRVVNEGSRIRLVGVLDSSQREILRLTMADLVMARGMPRIETEIASTAALSELVSGIALAPQVFVVGRDGRRYVVGDTLADGSRLTAIEQDGIVIEKEGFREKITRSR